MRATARLVAVAGEAGGTRMAVLRSQSPLVLRRTGPADVHLVGGAAGPLGGDELRLDIDVGPGAELRLRTVAASVALPGGDGSASRLELRARVAAGARLEWLPEPLIAAAGCCHVAAATVDLAAGARLVWREELVCGRYGEEPGDARLALAVDYDGGPLYRNALAVGPGAPGWHGPAVLGGARAAGSVLLVEPAWAEHPPAATVLGPTAAVLPLAGPAVLVTATAPDALTLRRHLDAGYRTLAQDRGE
jgi:urease accessory protein